MENSTTTTTTPDNMSPARVVQALRREAFWASRQGNHDEARQRLKDLTFYANGHAGYLPPQERWR